MSSSGGDDPRDPPYPYADDEPDDDKPGDAPKTGRVDPGARGWIGGAGGRSYGLEASEVEDLRRGAPVVRQRPGLRKLRRTVIALVVTAALVIGLATAYVRLSTRGERYAADDVPAVKVAIVFGAGLRNSGEPSPMLEDRISLAVALYKDSRVSHLLMTGDHGTTAHDEVKVMHDRAVELGVPTEDITLDHAGFDTYDSCYRAEAIFGVEEAVLVTQRFHLARAIYTCRQLGIDAVGVGAEDWDNYPTDMPLYEVREVGSTLKALVELHVLRSRPKVLGPEEPIDAEPAR